MNGYDIISMEHMKDGLKLLAGAEGLHRTIRWVYFADATYWNEDNFDPNSFVHGGELIMTIEHMTGKESLALVKMKNQRDIE